MLYYNCLGGCWIIQFYPIALAKSFLFWHVEKRCLNWFEDACRNDPCSWCCTLRNCIQKIKPKKFRFWPDSKLFLSDTSLMLLETEPYSQLLTGVRQRLSGLFILQIFVLPKFLSEFGCILYYKIYVAWYNGILCNSWIRLTNLYVKIPLFISWTSNVCLFNMLDIPVLNPSPFHFQDLVSNPYCVLYNFYYFSLENLVSD